MSIEKWIQRLKNGFRGCTIQPLGDSGEVLGAAYVQLMEPSGLDFLTLFTNNDKTVYSILFEATELIL